jgi:hypothetical protein
MYNVYLMPVIENRALYQQRRGRCGCKKGASVYPELGVAGRQLST